MDNEPVCCDLCLLCQLNSSDRHMVAERIDTNQGTVAEVICKHFWLSATSCTDRYICTTCWNLTYSFHKFYQQIERLHFVLNPASVKQEPPNTTQAEAQLETTSSEQLIWLDEGSALITNVNEVYVKENIPESDDEPIPNEQDDESDDDSNIPLAALKQAAKTSLTKTILPPHDDTPSKGAFSFPGVGLSLCRINGGILELCCHDCYRKPSRRGASDGSEENARFTFAALLKHYRKVHGKAGYAVCCNRKYTRRRSLKMHLLSHGRKAAYRCIPCGIKFRKQDSLDEHNLLIHTSEEEKRYRCDKCEKAFATEHLLNSHSTWHENVAKKNICCSVCNIFFASQPSLEKHRALHHLATKSKELNISATEKRIPEPGEEKLVASQYRTRISATEISEQEELIKRHCLLHCNRCDFFGESFTQLKQHAIQAHDLRSCDVQTYHGGGFNLICDICAKGFNSRALFENHRLTHSVEGKSQLKQQCEHCKKWLRNKKSYQQHRIRCHANNGPVTCKFCGKESVNASALKSHVHLHHAARPQFPCTFCEKRFKTALRLREHEATHTGTILYRCPWCPRTFACGSNMYKHKKAGHPLEWAASVKKRFGER
uniref:C2H2-type domain-containing protein n=1 Tax=Anopheles christyi TaxID=43041 RepID=A0A182K354_9DIPT